MIKVRTHVVQKMYSMMLLFVIFLSCSVTFADELPAADGNPQVCESKCGCNEMYLYDAANDRCLINFKKVMKRVLVIYDKQNIDVLTQDGMAKSIYLEGEKIFKGILISVILIMTCAIIGIVIACMYCCRINYTDRTLKNDVKAVAKKLKTNINSKNMTSKLSPLSPMSQSCSVVVEPAGVFVA